jgi:hypothetical protein
LSSFDAGGQVARREANAYHYRQVPGWRYEIVRQTEQGALQEMEQWFAPDSHREVVFRGSAPVNVYHQYRALFEELANSIAIQEMERVSNLG